MSRFGFKSFSIAIGTVAIAIALYLLIDQFVDLESPFLLFLPVVIISACCGNVATGVLTTLLTVLIIYYSFIDPNYCALTSILSGHIVSNDWQSAVQEVIHTSVAPDQQLRLGLFALEGCSLSLLLGRWFPVGQIFQSQVAGYPLTSTALSLHMPLNKSQLFKTEVGTGKLGDRSLVDADLQAKNHHLTCLLESITDAICTVDQDWRFTYVNHQSEQLLNQDRHGLLGKSVWEVLPAPIQTIIHNYAQQVTAVSTSITFEEFCVSCNSWLEINIYPADRGFIIYARNINARKQVEAERNQLLSQEQRIRATVELAERQANFLAEASRVLSSSLDFEMALKSIARLIVPFLAEYCIVFHLEDRQLRRVIVAHADPQQQLQVERLAKLYQPYLHHPNSLIAEVFATRNPILINDDCSDRLCQIAPNNADLSQLIQSLNPQSCIFLPLIAREEVIGLVHLATSNPLCKQTCADLVMAEDLTKRAAIALDNARLYQQAQILNRLKDEFLATLSHELRTPLNAVLGWSQLLQKRQSNDETMSRAVDTIARNARIQAQIVNDLLDVSQIITGRLTITPQWTAISSLIKTVVDSLTTAAAAKSLTVEQTLDLSVDCLWIDPKYMQQVIWNLVSNAIKFTPNGGRIEIILSQVDGYAQIQVTDTGKGISGDFLPYVFDRFRQADASTRRSHGGLGLGLAIVRHLVELHGGTITAESAGIGQGSTFTLHLHLKTM